MNKKRLSLWACLLFASGSLAQTTNYAVRNGDHDWSIASKFGVKASQIRAMNPQVKNWERLQIGQKLNVPTQKKTKPPKAVEKKTAVKISKAPLPKNRAYVVQENDNDWIIARKVGIKPSELRAVNPGVNWLRLRPGKTLNVPGSVVVSRPVSKTKVAIIRTSRAKVSAENVIIRKGPSSDAPRVRLVDSGAVAKVLDRDGSWYKLRFTYGTVGWVRGDLLQSVKSSAIVSNNRRNRYVRSGRVASHSLSSSTRSSKRSNSYDHQVAMNLPSTGNQLLDRAHAWRGVRYRYGGSSRSGTDCSGFTMSMYKGEGVNLPRRAIEQSSRGKSVNKGELKPGDLVFFKTNRGTRINHVGIYVGNGKFIHSSSGKGSVRTDSINEGYYQRRFAGARRVANVKNSKSENKPTEKEKDTKKELASKDEASGTEASAGAKTGTDAVSK